MTPGRIAELRAEFEGAALARWPGLHLERRPNGCYVRILVESTWQGWCMAFEHFCDSPATEQGDSAPRVRDGTLLPGRLASPFARATTEPGDGQGSGA